MNQNKILAIIFLVFIFGAFIMFATRSSERSMSSKKIHIVSSFYPLTYLAQEVGGNLVEVKTLVPAGAEPHDFEPSTRDFVDIGKADLLLYNGASFEPWINKWKNGSFARPKITVNMTESLALKEMKPIYRNGAVDPHFWLDPMILKKEGEIVRDTLAQVDPDHKDIFIKNMDRLALSLDTLDAQFRTALSACSLHDVVVLHEAFGYPSRAYNFRVTSIAGISPDEEPSPKDLTRIVSLAREKHLQYIFSETVASPKFAELIAREVGALVLVLNPIESLTPNEVQSGENYISIMGENIKNLKKALVCN